MRQTWTTWPRRVRWPLLSVLVALLGLGTLYSSYCYGLWGRNTLLLQYLFQCNCPTFSEQVRYREFTVLVPACRWPEVEDMSADGRYLIVTETASPRTTYRLDTTTGTRAGITLSATRFTTFQFLTNRLLLVSDRRVAYALLDSETGQVVPIERRYPSQLDPRTLEILRGATRLLTVGKETVALASDPLQQPDKNRVIYNTSITAAALQEELRTSGVTLPLTRLERPFGTKAGTARTAPLWADQYGIYTSYVPSGDTEKVLLRRTGFTRAPGSFRGYSARGWTTNDQGVVYASSVRYVLENIIDFFGTMSLLPVPQPVLLLPAPPVPEGGG